jgi:hypothetical protein
MICINAFAPENEDVRSTLECGGWTPPCHDDEKKGGMAMRMTRKSGP